MNNQDEALDFKLKVLENNRKVFFEGCKQIEYKAYINLTLSSVLLGIIINIFNKVDYFESKAKIIVISGLLVFSVLNIIILFFSMLSLRTFDLKYYLSYDFFTFETINNSLGLKDNLLIEILEKYKGLVTMYNTKDANLDRSTKLLAAELGLISGLMISFLIQSIYV